MCKSRSRLAVAGIVVGVTLMLAGCYSEPYPVENLPACEWVSEAVPVEELGAEPWASCDMEGLAVQFPDGTKIDVPSSGHSRLRGVANSVERWHVRNWGGYSVIAFQRTQTSLHYWGSLEGIEDVRLNDPEVEHD